ncbi:MAG: hypothetical protein LW808_002195 [Verrucomicrobiota bacterium]|nr:MAG: hypothetical protein LW808_002195 [Verrucomicrobiota bacterium]
MGKGYLIGALLLSVPSTLGASSSRPHITIPQTRPEHHPRARRQNLASTNVIPPLRSTQEGQIWAAFPQKLTVTPIQNLQDTIVAMNLLFDWYARQRDFQITVTEEQQMVSLLQNVMDVLKYVDWKEEITLKKARYTELKKQWKHKQSIRPPRFSPTLIELQAYETLFQQLFDIATSLDLISCAQKAVTWWRFLNPSANIVLPPRARRI